MKSRVATPNYVNCPVIVYDDEKNFVTKAIITRHERMDRIIEISDDLEDISQLCRLSIVIIFAGGAAEYGGTRRKTRKGVCCEIALFNERQREGRASFRHKLNSPAKVTSLVVESGLKPFDPPVKAVVDNISTSGAYVIAPPGHFKVDSVLEINVNIQGKSAMLYGQVVRVQKVDERNSGFGCKFIFYKQ